MWGKRSHTGVYLLDSTAAHQSQCGPLAPAAPVPSATSSLLPPSFPLSSHQAPLPTCVGLYVCVWMHQEPSWLCQQWEESEEGEELKEPELWLQSSMTQSGCIHCLGGKTQSMYQNTRLSPLLALCNQYVQMLTFPHLTSSSVSLSPAVLE